MKNIGKALIFKRRFDQQGGFILPVLLITGLMIVLMIMAISGQTVTNRQTAQHANYAVEAQMAADAGLDNAMSKMNTVANWTGDGSEQTLLNDATQKIKTTYAVAVTSTADPNKKSLDVTAKLYSPISAATPKVTRKYSMDIQAVTSGTGPTSVASGVGGLILDANAKISGGDVVVNGKITMNNNSQIGLTTNSVNVRVAHQSCPSPANASYPQVCGAGQGQPISLGNNAKIYANVQATNQTTGANMFNPGLIAGSTFAPISLPAFDRTAFKNAVNASGQTLTGVQASTCSGGIVNWPANVKITGNVSTSNNCTIKVNGNAWISGSFTPGNNGVIAIQNGVGTTMPSVVVDGSGGITLSNNASVVPNSSNTGVEMLTFWSAAPCSPDCSNVTGTDLYTSQNTTTINLTNNGAAQQSVLYAYWSKAIVSNNGALGAVAGQTVELGNNAVISFTASVPGSNNLVTTWTKRGYMRVYN